MAKMMNARVLLSGMTGLGVEIAKNVILAGVKSFTIHDDSNATLADLSSQFYLSEADVGSNRAEASLESLRELNDLVPVDVLQGTLECTPPLPLVAALSATFLY